MLQRGPQLLTAAFSEQGSDHPQGASQPLQSQQISHPLFVTIQQGSLLYARILKMTWVHEKEPVTSNEFAQFFEGDISKNVVGIEMLIELLREVSLHNTDIYSYPAHRRVHAQFSKEPLLSCVKVALQFITDFSQGKFNTLAGL